MIQPESKSSPRDATSR